MKRSGFSHLEVENYQSIQSADVPLGPLTVIVGDNTAGKSALLRAIRAACFNETGTGFITHGADKTSVELTLRNGNTDEFRLRWRKKREGGATYDLFDPLNGDQHFSKLGSAVPPEVKAVLRIADIEVDKTLTITPQIHRQGEYAFLIDKSEGQAARALAKMTKLDVVVEAQGLIRSDLKRTRADLKATSELVADLERQTQEFAGLDEELHLLENISDGIGIGESEIRRIGDMTRYFTSYIEARRGRDEIGELPSAESLYNAEGKLDWLQRAKVALNDHIGWVTALSHLPDTLPDIPDWDSKLEQLQKMQTAFDAVKHADYALVNTMEEAEEVEKVHVLLLEEWNAQGTCSACGQLLPMALIR